MNNAAFNIDELEVDVLEARLEMAPAINPSLCVYFNPVAYAENLVNGELQKFSGISTCNPN